MSVLALPRPSWRALGVWIERRCDGPLLNSLLLLLLIACGVLLRAQHLGEPSTFTFDEELFVSNAHNYLVGQPDLNDHPPLGKLLLGAGMLAFGYNALGFRFASLCFGIQSLFVAYWLGRCLFRSERSGWFAAAFLAADGFFIAYSRVALLDGTLTCLVLASLLSAVVAEGAGAVALCAILVGLATSVKWSGAFVLLPVLAVLLLQRRVPRASLLLFALSPAVHVGLWLLALWLTDKPHDLRALFVTMRDLFLHHVEMGHRQNDLASPWYTWPLLYHPIVVKLWLHGRTQRYTSSAGNVLFWFPATLLVLGVPLLAALRRLPPLRLILNQRARAALDALSLTPELIAAFAWFALLSPWIVGRGNYTFMYHYLPSYAFALVLLAGVVARLERTHAEPVCAFVVLAALCFVYFAPVWGDFSITEAAANRRLLWKSWRP
ncbi:MAG: phospholipid carrier-dependent glycosyltransferase [Polyangiaceae bacterium]